MINSVVIGLSGKLTIEKYKCGADKPYEISTFSNAVQNAGGTHILDLISGGASSPILGAGSVLRIYNNSAVLQKSLSTLEAGYPTATGGVISLRWRDATADSYPVYETRIYFPGDSIYLSLLVPNFGTKPNTEAWTYTYTLSFNTGTSGFTADAQQQIAGRVAGISGYDAFTGSNFAFFVTGLSGQGSGLNPASIVRNSLTVTWTWTANAGVLTGDWPSYSVTGLLGGTEPANWIYQKTTTAGTKGANTTRNFSYALTLTL